MFRKVCSQRSSLGRGVAIAVTLILLAIWILSRHNHSRKQDSLLLRHRFRHLSAGERFDRSRQLHKDMLGEADTVYRAGHNSSKRLPPQSEGPAHQLSRRSALPPDCIHIATVLMNIRGHEAGPTTFLTSLFRNSRSQICLHVVADAFAGEFLKKLVRPQHNCLLVFYDSGEVAAEITPFVKEVRASFSTSERSYYSNPLFFIAPVLYRILPATVEKVIFLDTDLRFKADVTELHALFRTVRGDRLIAMAPENQPVYRHVLYKYIQAHPESWVGRPHPDGVVGYNSGVMLQDLAQIRESNLYRSYMDGARIQEMVDKYMFQGHLGGQDLFTLISLEEPQLFHRLPCQWNRQLCRFWQRGYADVFDKYYSCPGAIAIYHGNCHTPIPPDL